MGVATLIPGQLVPAPVAWRGLAGTGLCALAAGLSLQAHVLAAPDLGGGLGVSADEASWVPTAATAAEGAAVLLAAYLSSAFGPRRVALAVLPATMLAAVLGLVAADLPMVVAARCLGALASGMLPVLMMVWAIRAFPPPARGLPLMLFAFASSLPAALALSVDGLAVQQLGGKAPFWLDLAWAPLCLAAAARLLPREPAAPERLLKLDWAGYALLAAGVTLLLVVLGQGERRFWQATPWMTPLTALGMALAALSVARLLIARTPFLDLGLLARPTFAIGLAQALCFRFALLMASFAVPQALMRLQGLRPEQAGQAVLWLAAGQLVGFPLTYAWLRTGDGRWSLSAGLAVFAAAALWAATIDPRWSVAQFVPIMVLCGLGQGLFLTSVMTFATWDVPPPAGPTAAGLFNLSRVLGTAGATAAVGYGLRIRENLHSANLVEALTSASEAANSRLQDLAQGYAALTPDGAAVQSSALAALAQEATRQAFALAFADVFLLIAAVLALFAVLVPLLPRLPCAAAPPSPAMPLSEGARP